MTPKLNKSKTDNVLVLKPRRRATDYLLAICERVEWLARIDGLPVKKWLAIHGVAPLPEIYRLAKRGMYADRRANAGRKR